MAMKKADIKIGGLYRATINGKMTIVRVDATYQAKYRDKLHSNFPAMTHYDVTEISTGDKIRLTGGRKLHGKV